MCSKFQIFIKTYSNTITFIVDSLNLVKEIKFMISQRLRIPFDSFYLTYACKHLENEKNLAIYGISNFSTIFIENTIIHQGTKRSYDRII